MRLNWGLGSLLFVLVLATSATRATELRDLKVLALDGNTRAVLALSGPAKYRMFTLENPRRLVLDLDATQTAGQFRLPGSNGVVSAVRTGRPAQRYCGWFSISERRCRRERKSPTTARAADSLFRWRRVRPARLFPTR